ncbi:hypothetical protein OSB04_021948 [Centaurea solstitialis]|uniref:BAR domain-containing protein n=1 Tax=Centaurea solstitialis TaxID=347529 RepID=A0AA38SV56_9ASTR|nr:hypothetical protein OSB04_021948 [Centaurea solstitialis]
MKTPFIKVGGLGLGLHRDNNKRDRQAIQRSQLDELSQASQDMVEMRDCYDSLLSAAAGTTKQCICSYKYDGFLQILFIVLPSSWEFIHLANYDRSISEFSESLQEMGDCLLAKTALSDDEDSGRVLLMLGKVQFDIQKLIDNYRSHISQTITAPSESLLNELRVVEDMKKQCDEKRMAYEVMKTQHEKGRSKNSKGEYVSSRQLQSARDEFDEDATLFILRMKSLKNGQSRSLLTQAARHHAAQVFISIINVATSYPMYEVHSENSYMLENRCVFSGRLSNLWKQLSHMLNPSQNSSISITISVGLKMMIGILFFLLMMKTMKMKVMIAMTDKKMAGMFRRMKFLAQEIQWRQEFHFLLLTQKALILLLHMIIKYKIGLFLVSAKHPFYIILCLQLDNKDLIFSRVGSVNSQANSYRKTSLNTGSKSAPLSADTTFDRNERYRPRKLSTYVLPTPFEKNSAPSRTGTQHSQQIPPTNTNMWHSMPLEQKTYENTFRKEKISRPIVSNDVKPTSAAEADSGSASTSKKIKRDGFSGPMMGNIKRGAFSGPLIGGFQSKKPLLSTSGSIGSTTNHLPFSGPLFRSTLNQPSDVITSSGPLPTIRELHELPRPPPANMAYKKTSKVGFSAPLITYRGDIDDTAKAAAYTLPLPTSKSQRESWKLGGDEAKVSPPLSPIPF